jgi:hypothetical protein
LIGRASRANASRRAGFGRGPVPLLFPLRTRSDARSGLPAAGAVEWGAPLTPRPLTNVAARELRVIAMEVKR